MAGAKAAMRFAAKAGAMVRRCRRQVAPWLVSSPLPQSRLEQPARQGATDVIIDIVEHDVPDMLRRIGDDDMAP